jgi:hypothetical protein
MMNLIGMMKSYTISHLRLFWVPKSLAVRMDGAEILAPSSFGYATTRFAGCSRKSQGDLVSAVSQLVGEENPIGGDREGLFRDSLHVDLHYLPLLSSAVKKGASLGDRFVTIHVEIAFFTGWIAVVPKH